MNKKKEIVFVPATPGSKLRYLLQKNDDMMSQVLSALEGTAKETILHKTGSNKKQRIPDWKEDVAPFKDNAHFWHSVWVSAGKPLNTTLHTIMKKSRNRYHLILRKKENFA